MVNLLQGKPLLDIMAMYLDYTMDRGFGICGYNSPQGMREHGTNKTSSEVSVNMQNDHQTTQLKKSMRTPQLNRLIKKIGVVLGKPDIDCHIEIRGMSTMEGAKFTEEIMMRFQTGLITREEAISRLDKISIEEAEAMAKKIEEAKQQNTLNNSSNLANQQIQKKPGQK